MLLQEKKPLSIYFEPAGAICGNNEDMAHLGRRNGDESLPGLVMITGLAIILE
jgi:hypothetical protein